MSSFLKQKYILVAVALFSLTSSSVFADMFQPSHSCSKPYKPYQFNHQYEVDNFNEDVRRYKECINDFVEEQNDAVRKHSNAAEEAIDDWNNFVSYELN
ncbi:hypothetical protein CSB62_25795 [Vibrio splendidus]|uniref:Uncharacterized protein n=2 Tax=Vibrio TaxID=662 RepID=A0AA87C1J2_9VIBR|nr:MULTISPECIES: hypothetical protein [Vibrio]PHN83103.1 hypothetical protein CSB62_25795 [Vibrio splendidus]CAK2846179.1 conserved exported hypothetical protein [Vibrio crassostreae]CDT70479.1 conserved exported hypothetical protein [Vibrio coralliirubri]SBS68088.1 hypothetical protein VAT7223_04027 [Vibrio atlanticus]